jgi:hypothetical protein
MFISPAFFVLKFLAKELKNKIRRKSDAGCRNSMCAMQENFCFYRKGTRKFLSEKYDVAAEVSEMPLKKSGIGRKCTDTI